MSDRSQQVELDILMKRPRGRRLVLGVAWRVVVAAALLGLGCWSVVSAVRETRVPEGVFQVSRCEHEWYQDSGEYLCSGTLRTAPGGQVVTEEAKLSGGKRDAGSTVAVRYASRLDPDTNVSGPLWLAARDSLIAVALSVGGVMALVNAVRRIRPDLAWLRPKTKQWGLLGGGSTFIIVLAAVASLVCAVVARI